jgi:hypothetical protein
MLILNSTSSNSKGFTKHLASVSPSVSPFTFSPLPQWLSRSSVAEQPSSYEVPLPLPLSDYYGTYHSSGYGTAEVCPYPHPGFTISEVTTACAELYHRIQDSDLAESEGEGSSPSPWDSKEGERVGLLVAIESFWFTYLHVEHKTLNTFVISPLTKQGYISKVYVKKDGKKTEVRSKPLKFKMKFEVDDDGSVEGFGIWGVWGEGLDVDGVEPEGGAPESYYKRV